MVKVNNFAGISPVLTFSEFDFYNSYRQAFEKELSTSSQMLWIYAR